MVKIAVTGATGFVGGHLLDALEGRAEVCALTRRPQPPRSGVTWIAGDLADRSALAELVEDADVVFHLAGLTKALSRADFLAVNAEGTRALLEAAGQRAPETHFVHVSSFAAREPHLSPYAASKRAAEDAVRAADRISWTILRPPGIYGPGDREILKLLRAACRGVLPVPGRPDNRVSLIYGPDLAHDLVELSGRKALAGATLEADDGSPGGYSYRELAHRLSAVLERPVRPLPLPSPVLQAAGGLNEAIAGLVGRPAMLTYGKARELLHPDWVARIDGSRSEAKDRRRTDLETGIRQTVDWAVSRGLLRPPGKARHD